ncbi:UNVERIFIED_CONTAM: hypothetical protein ABID98_001862 [Brevibacillus sp. OAP136]
MLSIWILLAYLFVGVIYAYYQSKEMISTFEEEIDENDPENLELINARYNLHEHLRIMHNMIGNRNMWIVIMLFFMIFWMPLVIYGKYKEIMRK